MLKKNLLFVLFIFYIQFLQAQKQGQARVDSLVSSLSKANEDTNKVLLLNELSIGYYNINPDEGVKYGELGIALAKKLHYKIGMAKIYYSIGFNYLKKSDFPKSLDAYFTGLKLFSDKEDLSLEEKKIIARINGNIGTVYREMGYLPKAFEYYSIGLKMQQNIGNKQGEGEIFLKIGIAYQYQKNYTKALDYFNRALKIEEEFNNPSGMATNLANIGGVYREMGNYTKSLEYTYKGMKIDYALGIKNHIALNLNNIGDTYFDMVKDTSTNSLPDSLRDKKKLLKKAENLQIQAIAALREIKNQKDLQLCYISLATIQEYEGNFVGALANYKHGSEIKDSVFSQKNQAKINLLEKQILEDLKQKEIEIQQLQLVAAKKERWYFISGLCVLLLLLTFAYNRFKVTQKQKNIIASQKEIVEKQKHLVEEHQKEIIDSITYAKRLQQAILPSHQEIKKHFPYNFIYYKPKDIVAGDFYWMQHLDNITYIAAADSTGHGVPGAMVSVVCSNALNRAVKEFGLRDTGKILDKTRELVLETFEKSGEEIKDGMDISLLAIDKKNKNALWSGANNQLWYMQNNELLEIKADKQPIGKTDNLKPFTTHTIQLKENTLFYLITDGYPDQFGGPKGKKFKYHQLEYLLVSNNTKPLEDQYNILASTFNTWKGDLEQVDDVTIIGIKI